VLPICYVLKEPVLHGMVWRLLARVQYQVLKAADCCVERRSAANLGAARGRWSFRMLAARGPGIFAGTNQIQHNIIGERVLGLPKGG